MARRMRRNLGPSRKRMKRPARLPAARAWLQGLQGRRIVRAYARWFGVDLLCAVKELRMLGVAVDPEYEQQIRVTIETRAAAQWARRQPAARRVARYLDEDLPEILAVEDFVVFDDLEDLSGVFGPAADDSGVVYGQDESPSWGTTTEVAPEAGAGACPDDELPF